MDFAVVWSEPALDDLRLALTAARDGESLRREVLAATALLSQFPYLGPSYERDETGTVREVACRGYRVFYRVDEDTLQVEVLRVWSAKRRDPKLPG